jgi:hypothetical protein
VRTRHSAITDGVSALSTRGQRQLAPRTTSSAACLTAPWRRRKAPPGVLKTPAQRLCGEMLPPRRMRRARSVQDEVRVRASVVPGSELQPRQRTVTFGVRMSSDDPSVGAHPEVPALATPAASPGLRVRASASPCDVSSLVRMVSGDAWSRKHKFISTAGHHAPVPRLVAPQPTGNAAEALTPDVVLH